jgi:hypothetical protein
MQDINEHSDSITRAENCLNVHIRRIIRNFKTTVKYDELMSSVNLANGAVDKEVEATNEVEITNGITFTNVTNKV